ncbi:MAG: 3',5'-cyclic-AMP phosphodiesterase [Methylomicrobium sp.]
MTANNGSLSLLQISDLHILAQPGDKMIGVDTECYFEAVLQHARHTRAHYDLVLVTGDLAQDPCTTAYRRIQHHLQAFGIDSICLPGNHDDYGMMQKILNSENVSCNKQRLIGNWQILCLNSQIPGKAGGNLNCNELRRIEAALEEHWDLFTLIAVHHHCLPTQSAWMDTMMIKNSEEFLEIVSRYPQIKAVLCGHIHQEMDVQLSGLRVLGTPSTCFQFEPLCSNFTLSRQMPGYRILDLQADGSIDTRIYRLPGKFDELDFTCAEY